jgi:hypothetical protein
MATPNTYSSDEKEQASGVRKRWWLEPRETVALELSEYCKSLENAQQKDRYLGMVFSQLATGRAPTSYGIQMDGKIKGDLATSLFSPPSENYVAIAIDVFANKIGKNQPFLQWTALSMDDTDVRVGCEQATQYTDQIFEDLKTWPLVAQCFKHGCIHGTGPVLVDDDKKNRKVTLTRLNNDEVLLDPSTNDNPPNFQIRLFANRHDVIRRYITGAKDEPKDLKGKLLVVPGCRQGFFALDVGYADILALCVGFYIPGNGEPGRKVVCVGDILLLDEEFKDDLPVAAFRFEPIDDDWKAQGCVEQQLPLQREVDRIADNLSEQERRFCWAKWGYSRNEDIDPDQLIGNSNVEFNEKAPENLDTPEPPEKLYEQLEKKGEQCLARVGISLNQSQGTPDAGINAGVAIIAAAQIDDVRHVAVAERLETFVEHLGKLIIQAAGRCKPEVYSSGQKIDWPEVANDQKKVKCRAFPMSGLPQSIPGRRQAISDMYTNGEIDKATYRRALRFNDVEGTQDALTETDDFIKWQLDNIVKDGKFDPPLVWADFARALSFAQVRLMREIRNKIPESRIQLIAQYAALCAQRVKEQQDQQMMSQQPAAVPSPGAPQPPATGETPNV